MEKQLKRFIKSPIVRGLFWFGVVAVSVTSLLPHTALPSVGVWDKAQHFIAYAGLGGLGWLGYPDRRHVVMLLVGLIALGAGLEVGQSFVPGRAMSMGDVMANTLGVLGGLIVGRLIWLPPRDVN